MFADHWPATVFALAGLLSLALGAVRRGPAWLAIGVALLLFAAGAFVPAAIGAACVFAVLFGVLLLSGWWRRPAALALAALGALGLGGLLLPGSSRQVHDLIEDAATLQIRAPLWLLLRSLRLLKWLNDSVAMRGAGHRAGRFRPTSGSFTVTPTGPESARRRRGRERESAHDAEIRIVLHGPYLALLLVGVARAGQLGAPTKGA